MKWNFNGKIMKTRYFIMCAALATMFAGCTSDDDLDQNSNGKTFTAKVEYSQSDDATTRALTSSKDEGEDIPVVGFNTRWFSNKTTSDVQTRMTNAGKNSNGNMSYIWQDGDKMGLLYSVGGTLHDDYLTNLSGNASIAKFSRDLTFDSSLENTAVAFTLYYPYRVLASNGINIKHILAADQGDGTNWSAQTMTSITSLEPQMVKSNSTITLGANKDFTHHMVYVKFVIGCGSGSPYMGKSVKAVTLYTDVRDGLNISPGIEPLAGGIEWKDIVAGTTDDASLASLWTNTAYASSFPHYATLSSASAFTGTITTDFGLQDETNLIYKTACSVKGSMLVVRPALSYQANQLKVKVVLSDNTTLYSTLPTAQTFTAGYLRVMKFNLDDFKKYSVTYETEDINKGTVTCPLKGANVTTQDLLPSGFGFIANTNSTTSSDNYAYVKATGKTGFGFTGWEYSTDGGLNWTSTSDGNPFNSSVSNDNGKIYRAKFSGGHTLTYHSNYGDDLKKSESRITGSYTELTDNTFTRYGYNFLGWSESNTATTATYGNKVKYTMPDADANLYAVWEQTKARIGWLAAFNYSLGTGDVDFTGFIPSHEYTLTWYTCNSVVLTYHKAANGTWTKTGGGTFSIKDVTDTNWLTGQLQPSVSANSTTELHLTNMLNYTPAAVKAAVLRILFGAGWGYYSTFHSFTITDNTTGVSGNGHAGWSNYMDL
jgi:hypothetical protein